MKRLIQCQVFAVLLSIVLSAFVHAADFKPVVIYPSSTILDGSFSESVYTGVQKFVEETGIRPVEIAIDNAAERDAAIRELAATQHSPIIAVGYSHIDIIRESADSHPELQFTVIDAIIDRPNVQSITFAEHEGSFLVGILAAMASDSKTIGFVGGMDIPLIRKFACGYRQGAAYVNSDIEVLENMIGTSPQAWNNIEKARQLAAMQLEEGADVIYAAAGRSGLGVLHEAAEKNKLSIGVDSNQNHLYPGSVLTSMLKRVDTAIYSVLQSARENSWNPGHTLWGLSNGGVGWSFDNHNSGLITEEMRTAVESASAKIEKGDLSVHDYTINNICAL